MVREDGTIHADAAVADLLVSDEEAQAQIEVSADGAKRSGKMGEVNLDVICENFEDGDVVDVDTLKAEHLISSKVGRIKVLARGVMNKKLTVKASKFSLQAVKMITLAGGKAELEE
jgi:large subunit ribosomal protein L15